MNKYLRNLKKIEFVVTSACTGNCKHCSQGDHTGGDSINKVIAADALRKIAAEYNISSVMTFGGAAQFKEMAIKQKKKVIELSE